MIPYVHSGAGHTDVGIAIGNIRQNLFFALIDDAAGVLYPFFGILLKSMFAAFEMSAPSLFVVLDALRLRAANI